jgi:hypothetical protein
VPIGRPVSPPPASFDVFTPIHRPEQGPEQDRGGYAPEAGYPQAYPDFGNPAPESGYVAPYDDNSHGDGPGVSAGNSFGNARGNNGAAEGRYQSGDSGGAVDVNGLPRRVRQASIAPELRAAAANNSPGSAGVPPATAASLSDMRNTLSAMQRGWQQGRSQTQPDTEGNRVDGD